jgi:ferredoxin
MVQPGVNVLSVDRAKCEGYGMCEQAAPKLLHLDEDDELVIDPAAITTADRPLADAAVRACPVAALRIESGAERS